MKPGYEIATILPPDEHFTPHLASAVSLFVRDVITGSAFQKHITVYGRYNERQRSFSGMRYQGITPSMEILLGRSGGYARALVHYLKQRQTGLIEVHNNVQVFNGLSKQFANTPITLHFHNDPLTMKGAETPKSRWDILARADAIYCSSDFIRRRFLTGLEAGRTDHVHIVYPGSNLNQRAKKDPFILYAGRLAPEKGALELARAAQILLPHFPNWKIAFVGANRPGGKNVTKYARDVGHALKPLGKQAVFLGHQPHSKVMQLFARAAIAVVPSVWNESVGRTAIEAMSAGCALVTSGHGGLAEITGEAGVLVSPITPQGLALALQGLLEDPETLRSTQQQCITRAPRFSLAALHRQLDGLRYQLLSEAYGG